MLEGCKTAKDRWGGVSDLIDNWLNERQELIVLYCSVTGIDRLQEDKRPLHEKLRNFCQILVDYVSAGHFEIYEQLQQEAVDFEDRTALDTAGKLLSNIQKTTVACLDFNDNFDKFSNVQDLQANLSAIGEALEERFELEDRMIEVLHTAHEELISG